MLSGDKEKSIEAEMKAEYHCVPDKSLPAPLF